MALQPDIKITWEQGTAYDLFTSLHILHFPDEYGLRGAWAAGVRSRLPNEVRDLLDVVIGNFNIPLAWIHSLPEPKDAATALLAFKRIAKKDWLSALELSPVDSRECLDLLQSSMQQGSWNQDMLAQLVRIWRQAEPSTRLVPGAVTEDRAKLVLDVYSTPEKYGDKFLTALETYYQVFFSEEEKRIGPKLMQALEKSQKAADKEGASEYLESASNRWEVAIDEEISDVTLVPSYWISAGYAVNMGDGQKVVLFGFRSKEESLVPGEIVPEDLLLRLKAMTDPTRMRILRYLLQEQLTPAELARRLRLRAPTVTHHLHTLKSSGMVQFVKKGKNEHLYYAKMDSIKETYVLLKDFLEQDVNVVEGFDFFDNDLI